MFKQSVILADLGRNDSATYLSIIYIPLMLIGFQETQAKRKNMFFFFFRLNRQMFFLSTKNVQQNITRRRFSEINILMFNVISVFLTAVGICKRYILANRRYVLVHGMRKTLKL